MNKVEDIINLSFAHTSSSPNSELDITDYMRREARILLRSGFQAAIFGSLFDFLLSQFS